MACAGAVGEPCSNDAQCAAVKGSGAICSKCGFCVCRRPDHTPDVHGIACGAGIDGIKKSKAQIYV